jgi:hypothetical protein
LVKGGECSVNCAIGILVWEELERAEGDLGYVDDVLSIYSL